MVHLVIGENPAGTGVRGVKKPESRTGSSSLIGCPALPHFIIRCENNGSSLSAESRSFFATGFFHSSRSESRKGRDHYLILARSARDDRHIRRIR